MNILGSSGISQFSHNLIINALGKKHGDMQEIKRKNL